MSLIFTESWDGAGTTRTNYQGKWTGINTGTIIAGRTNNCLHGNTASGDRWWSKSFTAAEEDDLLIVACAIKATNLAQQGFVEFCSDNFSRGHMVVGLLADGRVRVWRQTAGTIGADLTIGTTIATSATLPISPGVWHYWEIKTRLATSDSSNNGTCVVRIDGAEVLNATGLDNRNAGTKSVYDSFRIGLDDNTGGVDYDDLLVMNEQGAINNDFLGDHFLGVIRPDGVGNSSGFTRGGTDSGANWSQVEETSPNSDTDYVQATTDGTKDTYTHSNITGSGTVPGAMEWVHARKDDTGAKFIRHVCRSSASETEGASQALSTSYDWYGRMFETDPNGGIAWTITAINAAEWGYTARDS